MLKRKESCAPGVGAEDLTFFFFSNGFLALERRRFQSPAVTVTKVNHNSFFGETFSKVNA